MASPLFLGKGIAYPFATKNARINTSEGLTRIEHSIRQILSTYLGERVMRRDFGARLHELLFQPLNEILIITFQEYVLNALRRHERRAQFVEVEVAIDDQEATLFATIDFIVLATNQPGNFVYPFYLRQEALT